MRLQQTVRLSHGRPRSGPRHVNYRNVRMATTDTIVCTLRACSARGLSRAFDGHSVIGRMSGNQRRIAEVSVLYDGLTRVEHLAFNFSVDLPSHSPDRRGWTTAPYWLAELSAQRMILQPHVPLNATGMLCLNMIRPWWDQQRPLHTGVEDCSVPLTLSCDVSRFDISVCPR